MARRKLKHGVQYESTAREKYNDILKYKFQRHVKVKELGFVINPSLFWLGASADGFVVDGIETDLKMRLIEIKCPEAKKNCTPTEAIQDSGFYTFKGIIISRIPFDREYFCQLTSASEFYFKWYLPYLLQNKEKCNELEASWPRLCSQFQMLCLLVPVQIKYLTLSFVKLFPFESTECFPEQCQNDDLEKSTKPFFYRNVEFVLLTAKSFPRLGSNMTQLVVTEYDILRIIKC